MYNCYMEKSGKTQWIVLETSMYILTIQNVLDGHFGALEVIWESFAPLYRVYFNVSGETLRMAVASLWRRYRKSRPI